MKTIWKLYYKWVMGEEYAPALSRASMLSMTVRDSTAGKVKHFYNNHGEQIRGWHRKAPSFASQHPLITKYEY